jgi:hypothetical protein
MTICTNCNLDIDTINIKFYIEMLGRIAKFAELKNEKINDRLVVDVSSLLNELQRPGGK